MKKQVVFVVVMVVLAVGIANALGPAGKIESVSCKPGTSYNILLSTHDTLKISADLVYDTTTIVISKSDTAEAYLDENGKESISRFSCRIKTSWKCLLSPECTNCVCQPCCNGTQAAYSYDWNCNGVKGYDTYVASSKGGGFYYDVCGPADAKPGDVDKCGNPYIAKCEGGCNSTKFLDCYPWSEKESEKW